MELAPGQPGQVRVNAACGGVRREPALALRKYGELTREHML
ncbi:MAG TPA: hypothetical protein VFI00_09075 [Kribbella sp.]|nr:hypothetical protein [Kribbella sp.]